MRQSIYECTKKNLWKPAFKKFEVIWSAITSYSLKAVSQEFIKYKMLEKTTKSLLLQVDVSSN